MSIILRDHEILRALRNANLYEAARKLERQVDLAVIEAASALCAHFGLTHDSRTPCLDGEGTIAFYPKSPGQTPPRALTEIDTDFEQSEWTPKLPAVA